MHSNFTSRVDQPRISRAIALVAADPSRRIVFALTDLSVAAAHVLGPSPYVARLAEFAALCGLEHRCLAGPVDSDRSPIAYNRRYLEHDAMVHVDVDELVALNGDYVRSVQTSDVQRFEELLAPDFLCSNPDGSLVDRDAFLKQTARPVTISNLEASDVQIRVLGDVAIIHARTTFTAADGRALSGRYTDVWARRNGRWLAIAAHVTRLAS